MEIGQSRYGDLRVRGQRQPCKTKIMHINVKNCEESENLLYLKSNYLANYNYMDAGKD